MTTSQLASKYYVLYYNYILFLDVIQYISTQKTKQPKSQLGKFNLFKIINQPL
jgi:hypothetical protein